MSSSLAHSQEDMVIVNLEDEEEGGQHGTVTNLGLVTQKMSSSLRNNHLSTAVNANKFYQTLS